MNRFLSLVKVNMIMSLNRSGTSMMNGRKKKSGIGGKIAMGFLFLFAGLSFFGSGYNMAKLYAGLGLQGQYFSYVSSMALFMSFITVFSFTAATLFYSSDAQIYLAMPLSPSEILGSKLLSIVVQTYLMQLLVYVPMALAGVVVSFSLQSVLVWLLLFFLIPLVPTCLVTILMLLLLQIAPFLRNEKRLMLFTGMITMVGAISVSIIMQIGMRQSLDGALPQQVIPGLFGYLFPVLKLAPQMAYGETAKALIALGIFLLTNVVWAGLTFLLASKLYFPILLSMRSDAKGKTMSKEALRSSSKKQSSAMKSIAIREIKSVLRVPAYVLNSVISPYILLIVMFGGGIFGAVRAGANADFLGMLQEFFLAMTETPSDALAFGLISGLVIALFVSVGSLSSTTISRDAYHWDFFKSIPVPAKTIFMGKLLGSAAFVLPLLLILWIVYFVLLPFTPLVHLPMLLSTLLCMYGMVILDMRIDLLSPKLDWVDELSVVKQNKTVVFSQMKTFILIMAAVPLAMSGNVKLAGFLVTAVFALTGIVLTVSMNKNAEKWLSSIGESK